MDRLFAFAVIAGATYLLFRVVPAASTAQGAASTLAFGFVVLGAYLAARFLTRLRLPRITGFILAGMLFGPSLLGLVTREVVQELRLVDDLALTFIAMAAGGELRLDMLRERRRSILFTVLGSMLVVFLGVTLSLVMIRSSFPFSAGRSLAQSIAIAAIAGALAVARSPSSAIAIISETKAKGPFTEMVLGVTIAVDVLAIFIFAVTLSLSTVIFVPGRSVDVTFLLLIGAEVAASVLLGLLLGKAMALYLEKIRAELTIFTLGVAFLVTKVSGGLAHLLDAHLSMRFHLEPMLICMAAGFIVQNYSSHGEGFLRVIDRSSLPIYTIFFAMSGAALRLEALRATWHWALALVGMRTFFMYAGCVSAGRLAGDPPAAARVSGLSFLTQAGVSLGLVKLVIEAFPTFGADYAALLVASITINQIVGPVGLKLALSHVGETREARLARVRGITRQESDDHLS